MIIDQLPLLAGDVQTTDEIPIERGTTTYKTTQAALVKPAADAAAAAQSTADAAQTAADNAQTAADNAQTAADGAQQTANSKQDALVSGVNIKTVGGQSLLGSGDIDAGGSWDLLWTNPNPNSTFAAQTISINTDGYERLKIDFNLNTESPAGSEIYFTSEVGLYFNRALFFCFYGGKYVQRATPAGWVTPSTLTFGDGQISNTYGAVPSTANNYLIPVRIYAQ